MTDPRARLPPSTLRLALWSAALVVYGNLVNGLERRGLADTASPAVILALPTMVVLLIVAKQWEALTWSEMGLRSDGAARKATIGGGIGLALGGAALAIIRLQPVSSQTITYAPLLDASWADIAGRILVTMPADTILLEEIAFRGVLLGLFLRRFRPLRAVVLSSLVFMLWHLAVNYDTLLHTSWANAPLLMALGLVAAHAAVLAAGILFSALRLWTGSLAAPVAAHWTVNAEILIGLYLLA